MNQTISIAKAIAIILMVVGHSGCPELMNQFIYAFHMPLFFFVSGYLFKDKYLSTPFEFTKKKVKGLYIPFVKWSLIFLVFHNVLYSLGCYEDSYTLSEYGHNALRYITMMGSEQLLGGYWFLKTLLIVSIISFAVIKLCKYIHNVRIYIVAAILLLIISYFVGIAPFKIPFISSKIFLASFMFMCGYILKISGNDNILHKWYVPCIGFIGCWLIVFLTPGGVGNIDVVGIKLLPYTIAAILGTISVYSLSYFICKYMPNTTTALVSVGNKTLYILTFHFISFKLVSLFLIKIMGVEGNLYDFSTIPNIGGGWWMLYTIVGVVIPILLWHVNKFFNNRKIKWEILKGKQ